jgi:hypothetical protein
MSKGITRRRLLASAGTTVALVPSAQGRNLPARAGGGPQPVSGGVPFITSVTPGTLRKDATDITGFAFKIGRTPLVVTAVGRWVLSGNTHTHTVGIYEQAVHSTATLLHGSSVSVNTSGATPGQFLYVPLSSPVVLWSGQNYFMFSDETPPGRDTWYDNNTTVTTTADAVLYQSAYVNHLSGVIAYGSSGTNHPWVPVNFKYTVGVPGGITRPGSIFPYPYFSEAVFIPTINPIVTGTVTFVGAWVHGGTTPGESFTYQWTLDGVAISPVLTTTDNTLPWSCNTVALGIPDGSHVIYPRILDSSLTTIFDRQTVALAIIVANSGFNNGNQTIPVSVWTSNRAWSPLPDYIDYDASAPNPVHATYPFSYTFIAGSNSPTLRDANNWYGEVMAGPRNGEYFTNPEFVTTPSGGIYAHYIEPLLTTQTFNSYLGVVYQNSMDGTRLNAFVSPYTDYVEDPAGGGVWWGAEINGRVFKITPDGTVTTIVGPTRDRTQPTYDPFFPGLTEDDIATKTTVLGNFPSDIELGGANDLCFDPGDSNILYVVAQVDHWIGKIDLTTLNVTVYAGIPGTNGYTGDGGAATSATFDQPTSIIMDATGIMYVCDSQNSAIRKITAGGTISTFCGGTGGPSPPTISALTAPGPSYTVTSITWSSGTSAGAVVMAAPTLIQLGFTLDLTGATNIGGSGDPNTRYIVTAFTDSQHFTVGFEQSPSGKPTIGTIGGSPVFFVHTVDFYSSPTSVSFAAAYTPFPNVIRFTSKGDIVFGEGVTDAVRWVHLGSSTITRVNCFSNYLENDLGPQWIWLEVDTVGTCGPVDDIVVFKIQDSRSAAHWTWRMSLDGSYSAQMFSDGFSLPNYGPIEMVTGGPGHYPWAIGISRHEGKMIATGVAQMNPIVMWIKQAGDPVVTRIPEVNYSNSAHVGGFAVHIWGTAVGFPREVRPAFWSIWGVQGGGWITNTAGHNTWEDLNATYPTDAALGAYIQSGMGGAVPRPELVGNSLRDYIYYVRRGTLAGSLPTPYAPGHNDPNNAPAIILTASAVRNSSTQITVSWTTDKPTIGMVAAGAPGNFALGVYSLLSALENSYGTSHSQTVQVLSGVTPVHYVVVVEDQHGNFSHTVDLTVA